MLNRFFSLISILLLKSNIFNSRFNFYTNTSFVFAFCFAHTLQSFLDFSLNYISSSIKWNNFEKKNILRKEILEVFQGEMLFAKKSQINRCYFGRKLFHAVLPNTFYAHRKYILFQRTKKTFSLIQLEKKPLIKEGGHKQKQHDTFIDFRWCFLLRKRTLVTRILTMFLFLSTFFVVVAVDIVAMVEKIWL